MILILGRAGVLPGVAIEGAGDGAGLDGAGEALRPPNFFCMDDVTEEPLPGNGFLGGSPPVGSGFLGLAMILSLIPSGDASFLGPEGNPVLCWEGCNRPRAKASRLGLAFRRTMSRFRGGPFEAVWAVPFL
jgi:hypothetical protein